MAVLRGQVPNEEAKTENRDVGKPLVSDHGSFQLANNLTRGWDKLRGEVRIIIMRRGRCDKSHT